eukprot:7458321-Heterocapsa_arctica.AAC.1
MQNIPLHQLRRFEVYARERGRPSMATGPDIDSLMAKSRSHTAAARQHKIAGARVVDKGLLPRGMTPAQH